MLNKVRLTEDSIKYIEDQLSMGEIFSQNLRKIDLYNGFVFTYFPGDFFPQNSIDYSESLEFLFGKKVSEEFITQICRDILIFLGNNTRKIAIFETLWRRNDPIVARQPLQFFSINGRKYDFIKGKDKEKPIENYLFDAQGYPSVMAIIDIGEKDYLIEDKIEFNQENLSELTNNIEVLIIGAFDGEGYLVWQKKLQI